MAHRSDMRDAGWRRRAEMASIFVFAVVSTGLLLARAWPSAPSLASVQDSPDVTALASAMPQQGWAPLTAYFSAYGSRSVGAAVARYEWDLDGNGELDYDATSEGGYAHYVYSRPGVYTVTLRVTDSQGRSARDRVSIRVRHPASSSVDYWTVFDDRSVRRIDIALRRADWDLMWSDPAAKYQARADAVIFGERLEGIGFRMRGQFSLRESGDKKPWKIDTDAFVDGQEFHNLRQLMLLNNIGDPSLLKEKLGYEIMRFAGLPASYVAFVELWIDIVDDSAPPEYWGVYTLVERVDNKYLANRFGQDSTGGNLYKASHAQRGPMDLIYYGERIEDYPAQGGQYAYGKQNNEAEADYGDIIELCRVVDGAQYADEAEFVQALESVFDVDAFLRYMAVVILLDNWDTYPNTGNNYYLFHDPVGGRFEWIPWDLTWGENSRAPLFGRSESSMLARAPLYDRVFQVQRYRDRYAAYVELLLRRWFNSEHVSGQVQQYHRLIAPYVTAATGDKAFFGDQPMFPPAAFDDSWQGLVRFTAERHAFLVNALQQERQSAAATP